MSVQYYEMCKECVFTEHCFGREDADRIENNEMTDEDYLRPDVCCDYYPDAYGKVDMV